MSGKHDVNTYMEIRWYVNAIENLALSTYAGYPDRKDDIMSFLKSTAKSLQLLSRGNGSASPASGSGTAQMAAHNLTVATGSDCPWKTCNDGSCRPSCDIQP